MRDEFSAVREGVRAIGAGLREEIHAVDEALREEIRAGDEETRRFMRGLHEEVIGRFALIEEVRGPRGRRKGRDRQ